MNPRSALLLIILSIFLDILLGAECLIYGACFDSI